MDIQEILEMNHRAAMEMGYTIQIAVIETPDGSRQVQTTYTIDPKAAIAKRNAKVMPFLRDVP